MRCNTPQSWQGDRCAPPLHPPRSGAPSASNLIAPQKRPPFHPFRRRRSCPSRNPPRPSASPLDHDQEETSLSPGPHDQRRMPPLEPCTKPIAPGRDRKPSCPWTLILPEAYLQTGLDVRLKPPGQPTFRLVPSAVSCEDMIELTAATYLRSPSC